MEMPVNKAGLGDPNKCRAFVIHKMPRVDYSGLDRWASSILSIYTSSIFADQSDWSTGADAAHLKTTLQAQHFNPRSDYLVLGGDILRIASTMAVIGRNWSPVTLLRYDREYRGYWPFTLETGSVVRTTNVGIARLR